MKALAVKVLLVDDEPDILEISKQFLEFDRSISADTATSAARALEMIGIKDYDVIVADYKMPGKDGIQLLKEIRAMDAKIPFILFTGKGREDVAIEALNAGADYYLQKGWDPRSQFAELANMIGQANSKKKGEESLRISEERHRTLFENSYDSMIIATIDGKISSANPSACHMFDLTEDDLKEIGMEGIVVKDRRWEAGQRRLKEIGRIMGDFTYRRKDGTTFIGETTAGLFTCSDKSVRISVIIRDVTGKKLNQEKLKDSESRYRRLFETAQDGILIIDYKTEKIIDANKFILDMIGCPLAEVVGKNLWELGFVKDKQWAEEAFSSLRNNGYVRYENIPLRRKDGKRIDVEFISNVYVVNRKKIAQCNIRDVSERLTKDQKIKEMARIIDTSYDAIIGKDLKGTITSWNKGAERIFGYTENEIVGQSISLLHAHDSKGEMQEILTKISHGESISQYETTRSTKDGKEIIISFTASPVLDDQGRIIGASTIARDITEQKLAYEALRKSEERLRTYLDNSPEGIFIVDAMGNYQDVNRTACTMLNYSREELLNLNIAEISDQSTLQEGMEKFQELKEKGSMNQKTILVGKDGVRVPVFLNAVELPNQRYMAFCTDITVRKRSQEALQESEKRYRLLVESAAEAIVVIQDGLIQLVNPMTVALTSFSEQELISKPFSSLIHPDDRVVMMDRYQRRSSGETAPVRYKFRLLTKDGNTRWAEINAISINWKERPATLNLMTDITERKRAEEALRDAQARLKIAMDLAKLVHWEYDVATDTFTFDDQFYALFGTTAEREGGNKMRSSEYAKRFLPPEAAPNVGKEIEAAMMTTDPNFSRQFEHDIIRRDGERRTITVVFRAIKDPSGRTIKTYGANQDITERKRVEESLQKTNKNLNLLSSVTRHDINNQLITLMGNLTLLERKRSDPSSDTYIKKAEAAAERISAMIQFTKNYEDIGLHAPLWHDVRTLIDANARDITIGSIKVVNDVPAGTEMFVDPLITKVFHNLIDNAIRHGGTVSTIRFYIEEQDGICEIICEDDGIGISADIKKKLFTHGSGNDHGLGLFLSREILAITGITIVEKGEPGQGARFVMTVPKGKIRRTDNE